MRHRLTVFLFLAVCVFTLSPGLLAQAPNAPQRAVAITIDDLPASAGNSMTGSEILEMTNKLLTTLKDQKVPAVGFVNEQKLYKTGEVDDRIKALNLWLDDGFDLGNHTFAHTSLNRVPLQAWEEEVIRGETVTRMLLAQHKMKLRYLRHPYLDAGADLQTRREAEAFLTGRGYRVAPVTMDAWDWMYAGVYDDARKRGDTALQKQLVDSYLEYTNAVFDYFEKVSKNLFGYETKQILLLHGSWLEADHIGDVIKVLRKRGYQFVTLEDALGDGAYSSPDEYVGEGTGWYDHWAITRGRPLQDAPAFPQWVIDKSRELHPQNPAPASTPY
ncbi:MAG TPA: polysaccharide deacetylase family protein [Candidatus Saccharimonadales bacterium]|nr:polysaccharide deacetylase family protein [Candidatus Saccharimonadales bacterium]